MQNVQHSGDMADTPWGRHIWGDGLVEQSLSTLWYSHSWDDVDDDELIWYFPSLASHLCRHDAHQTAKLPEFLSEYLRRQRLIFTAMVNEAGTKSSQSTVAAVRWPIVERKLSISAPRVDSQTLSLLIDLIDAAAFIEPEPIGRRVTCTDALLLSLYARLNAAYLYPEFSFMHETFTCAAWLGHLVQGRTALLPATLAVALCEHLEDTSSVAPTEADECSAIIVRYAELCCGPGLLLAAAKGVAATGRTLTIAPNHSPGKPVMGWDRRSTIRSRNTSDDQS